MDIIPSVQIKKRDANFIPHYDEISFMTDIVPHHGFNLHTFNHLQNQAFYLFTFTWYTHISFVNSFFLSFAH